jgi:type III secretion system FlhB-like substrate exporter
MTILCYFKTSLVTFVQKITLKSMFSKEAYKSVASIFIYIYMSLVYMSLVYLFTFISRFNATIP